MSSTIYVPESSANVQATERTKKKTLNKRMVLQSLFLLLIIGVAGGSFTVAYMHTKQLQQKISLIETNAVQLNTQLADVSKELVAQKQLFTQVTEQFVTVQAEMESVKEQLSVAGSSLSSTAETKETLNERMADLNKQLEQLRTSIKQLEEAARVY